MWCRRCFYFPVKQSKTFFHILSRLEIWAMKSCFNPDLPSMCFAGSEERFVWGKGRMQFHLKPCNSFTFGLPGLTWNQSHCLEPFPLHMPFFTVRLLSDQSSMVVFLASHYLAPNLEVLLLRRFFSLNTLIFNWVVNRHIVEVIHFIVLNIGSNVIQSSYNTYFLDLRACENSSGRQICNF